MNIEIKSLAENLDQYVSDPNFNRIITLLSKKTGFLLKCRNNLELLVLRGHLAIEYFLNEIIKTSLPNGQILKLDDFNFYKKICLVRACNVLDVDTIEFISRLNTLRNKCAHEIEYRILKEEINKLAKVLPKKIYEETKNSKLNLWVLNLLSSVLTDMAFAIYKQ